MAKAPPLRLVSRLAGLGLVGVALALTACSRGPKKTCKVNDQCFVCPDDAAIARCKADPTRSRCKWTPPEDCR